jgi:hypothetical protein
LRNPKKPSMAAVAQCPVPLIKRAMPWASRSARKSLLARCERGMTLKPAAWNTPPQRHEPCLGHQVAGDSPAHRPAHDRAREKAQHDGQVQPAFAGPAVGDLRNAALVRRCGRNVLLPVIRRNGKAMLAVRRHLVVRHRNALGPPIVHQRGAISSPFRATACPTSACRPCAESRCFRRLSNLAPTLGFAATFVFVCPTGLP